MKQTLKIAIRLLVLLTVLTGIIYPLTITGLAHIFFPTQSNGSLIWANGHLVGSELIGQSFLDPAYFWGRLSATGGFPYNPLMSGGSNLGPMNKALFINASRRIIELQQFDPNINQPIPVDLVTASASGLDPHISVASARFQMDRVANARGLTLVSVSELVDQYTQKPTFGFMGEGRVNVLLLNLALDMKD